MEIILAQNIGFCNGVKNAYSLSLKALREEKKPCQMLGYLVHNEKVIERLEEKGLEFISSVEEAQEGTVIIRAHGAERKTITELQKKKVKIIDATCPLVKKAQDLASSLSQEGFLVVIIGDQNHPEVKAIRGSVDGVGIVIENETEIDQIPTNSKVGIIIQTTSDGQSVAKIIQKIKEKFEEVKVCNTLCPVTTARQQELRGLASRVDLILVVGSKKSANTQRLLAIGQEQGKNAQGVEDASDLAKSWFEGVNKVAVVSGTSTPDWVIEGVVDQALKINDHK